MSYKQEQKLLRTQNNNRISFLKKQYQSLNHSIEAKKSSLHLPKTNCGKEFADSSRKMSLIVLGDMIGDFSQQNLTNS